MAPREVYIGVHVLASYYNDQPSYVEKRDKRLHDRRLDQILLFDYLNAIIDIPPRFNDYRTEIGLEDNFWDERLLLGSLYKRSEQSAFGKPGGGEWWGFPEFSEFLLKEFPADQYVIWGAEVHLRNGEPVMGCVKLVHDGLIVPNKKIDLDYCWTKQVD